jgi:hypothetical protein
VLQEDESRALAGQWALRIYKANIRRDPESAECASRDLQKLRCGFGVGDAHGSEALERVADFHVIKI